MKYRYIPGIFYLLLCLLLIFYGFIDNILAAYAFAFTFGSFSVAKFSLAYELTRTIDPKKTRAGHFDWSVKILLLKIATDYFFYEQKIPFEKTREYRANYFRASNYNTRTGLSNYFDIVSSEHSVVTYEYSTDAREHLFTRTFDNLQNYLEVSYANYLNFHFRPGAVFAMDSILENGRFNFDKFVEDTEKGREWVERLQSDARRFVRNSYFLKILSFLIF